MAVMSAMLVGTVMAVCVLGTTLLGLVRNNNKYKVVKQDGGRKTSHVTELLQVDMVDRKIRMTSIDCSIEMHLLTISSIRADHVLSPVVGLSSSVIH
jgi:hypothetical protein